MKRWRSMCSRKSAVSSRSFQDPFAKELVTVVVAVNLLDGRFSLPAKMMKKLPHIVVIQSISGMIAGNQELLDLTAVVTLATHAHICQLRFIFGLVQHCFNTIAPLGWCQRKMWYSHGQESCYYLAFCSHKKHSR